MNRIKVCKRRLNRAGWIYASGVLCLMAPVFGVAQTSSYTISTAAGNNSGGFSGDGGPATNAQLNLPYAVAVDSSGTLYIADQLNHRVREVSSNGTIQTVAGSGTMGYAGDGKAAGSADLNYPLGVAVDSSGNLYIADSGNDVIREVSPKGIISTVAGQYAGSPGYAGDGNPAAQALLYSPGGIAVSSSGVLYIADSANNVVRTVSGGTINPLIGSSNSPGSRGDGGPAVAAFLNHPIGIAVDSAGNVYVADSGNNRIRKVAPDGTISTVAGTGTAGYSGDEGPAAAAQLNRPSGVAVDAAGNLYIADYANFRIREVTTNGTIFTIAGNGQAGYSGDGGPALSAELRFPSGIAIDGAGNIYIADNQSNVIRKLTRALVASPEITSVISLGAYGGYKSIAPGTWIEIHGSNLGSDTRTWANGDFNIVSGIMNAPTALDGTTVTIGNVPAFVEYISDSQINALAPSNVGLGSQQLTVSTFGGTSAAYPLTVVATLPGLYAPDFTNADGTQYVGAVFLDGVTFVAPVGTVSGFDSRPAQPGDTIVLYGIGFGPVTPDMPAGQVVQKNNTLASPVQILFGSTPAAITYQGLSPGSTGLYQFNVTVPDVPSGDKIPVTFTQDGVSGTQTLYTAVQAAAE